MKLYIVIVVSIAVLYFSGPWLLSFPVKFFTKLITVRRLRERDPEIQICPGCGYRGDKRSNFKTMTLKFERTIGEEKAVISCKCFRCGAEPVAKLYKPAVLWLPNMSIEELKSRMQQ